MVGLLLPIASADSSQVTTGLVITPAPVASINQRERSNGEVNLVKLCFNAAAGISHRYGCALACFGSSTKQGG
jgi:hypothetical protein